MFKNLNVQNLQNMQSLLKTACHEKLDSDSITVLFHQKSLLIHLITKRNVNACSFMAKETIVDFVKITKKDYRSEDYPTERWEEVKNLDCTFPPYKLFLAITDNPRRQKEVRRCGFTTL